MLLMRLLTYNNEDDSGVLRCITIIFVTNYQFNTLYTMYVVCHTEWFVYQDNIEYTSFDTQSDAKEFAKELIEAYPDSTVKIEEVYVY